MLIYFETTAEGDSGIFINAQHVITVKPVPNVRTVGARFIERAAVTVQDVGEIIVDEKADDVVAAINRGLAAATTSTT